MSSGKESFGRSRGGRFLVLGCALVLGSGCRSGTAESKPTAAASASAPKASASQGAAGRSPAEDERNLPPKAPPPWHIPVGISLPIVPGKGFGPIQFGARLDTVERLMAVPCEEKKQEAPNVLVCRYSAQAVEFYLTDGVVTRMRAHRIGRLMRDEPKLEFGIFNGRFVNGATFGMVMNAVQESLGKPTAVHKLDGANPYGTVEIHEYPNYSLEYDQLKPGQIVLGGVDLTRPAP
jgi:hypothetical protein